MKVAQIQTRCALGDPSSHLNPVHTNLLVIVDTHAF